MTSENRLSPEQRENLVAYRDGELTEQEMQSLDDLLARDPMAREEVEQLRQTWELLDALPRSAVTEEFTARTVASIKTTQGEPPGRPTGWPRRGTILLGWAIALTLSGIGGFLATSGWLAGEHRLLYENLSLVERLDAYNEIGNVDFLTRLTEQGLFPRAAEDASPIERPGIPLLAKPVPVDEGERKVYVASLPLEARQRLQRNLERVQQLVPRRLEELNRLDRTISSSPEQAAAAVDFYDWLKSLQPWQRDALRKSTDTDERLTLVAGYVAEQQRRQDRFRDPQLSSEDVDAVMQTIEDYLQITPEQRASFDQLEGSERYWRVLELSIGRRNRVGSRRDRWPGPELAAAIVESISDTETQVLLQENPDDADRLRQVLGRMVILGFFESRRPTNRQLQELFFSLSREDQDKLMRLPISEYWRILRKTYDLNQDSGNESSTLGRLYKYWYLPRRNRAESRERDLQPQDSGPARLQPDENPPPGRGRR